MRDRPNRVLKGHNRPLAYWIDYIRAFAGPQSSVIVVQSKCDERINERDVPDGAVRGLSGVRTLSFSARSRRGAGMSVGALRDAVDDGATAASGAMAWCRLDCGTRRATAAQCGTRPCGRFEYQDFESLCESIGGVSVPRILLSYLNASGKRLLRSRLFGGKVIVDQNWAPRGYLHGVRSQT
jgi:hypothetical protein